MGYLCLITALLLYSHLLLSAAATKKTYIVQMKFNEKPDSYNTHTEWYSDIVQSLKTSPASDHILYTYDISYHGFAAAMSPEEAQSLVQSNSVHRVYEDKPYYLHTTRTPLFLGLEEPDLWPGHTLGDLDKASQDVIIGVLDTGIWPESESFEDEGMTEVPAWWRGNCDSNFSYCNKKLIGAKSFLNGYKMDMRGSNESDSPLDNNGHGTHTSSTAAGSVVTNASLFGLARGSARGVAHLSRLAVYKVCGAETCMSSDILAGMEAAIGDGVDVISLSLGSTMHAGYSYDEDPIAIGAFAAMKKGIFVSCSAGNDGPGEGSVSNVAPWMMTVGAGTIDRDFPAFVTLGNGEKYTGASLYTGKGMGRSLVELVYGGGTNSTASKLCLTGSLDATLVSGKVVLCDRGPNRTAKGVVVKDAGGVGMIIANSEKNGGEELLADSHLLPALGVGNEARKKIREYMQMMGNKATAVLSFGLMELNVKPSPVVTAFSSRGPNAVTPQILKPDVIAPGMNILAAWPGAVSPTELPRDTRRTKFNIISGTSMSCPHVSGLAALLKAAHPGWSPSAIKSALMTTAYTLDNTNSPLGDSANNTISNPWAYGAGHVRLHKALAPGLVYNATTADYIAYLCSINYTIEMIQNVAGVNVTDCAARKFQGPGQLNYPSFSVVFESSMGVVTYNRELTSVEDAESIYQVYVAAPPEVNVSVQPSELDFEKVGDKKQYAVTFTLKEGVGRFQGFGSISWKNGKNEVTSPVTLVSNGS